MPFHSLTRPSSPTPRNVEHRTDAVLSASSRSPSQSTPPPELDMVVDSLERPRVEIILHQEPLCLRGTGTDVEPSVLTGHVALYLAESTSIKEITLHFRGKARLPPPPAESMGLQNSLLTFILCEHDWSFLEGDKRHAHTLKCGVHHFPFSLQLGGSLPSSTEASGGASVQYKLRAHVIRASALSHNLQAVIPVSVVRSFAPEALEYQQTLEIENTWPEKLMYSLMIPHKAWAIGDKLTAIATFSPLTKGTRILSVTSTIAETTKIYSRSCRTSEDIRTALSVTHDIVDGKAVPVSEKKQMSPSTSSSLRAGHRNNSSLSNLAGYFSSHSTTSATEPSPLASPTSAPVISEESSEDEEPSSDVIVQLSFQLPETLTPTHSLQPITVSHRLRWSILIANPDGHNSELRCSLPICLLDSCLLGEARMHTTATRRLLLGDSNDPDSEEEVALPSYTAHLRDRVANIFLPEGATVLTRVNHGFDLSHSAHLPGTDQYLPRIYSGISTPAESHTPGSPSGLNRSLDWVNSELMLSMADLRLSHAESLDTHPDSSHTSPAESRLPSRRPTRPPSPDHHHSRPFIKPSFANPKETYVHEHNHASRSTPSFFSTSMKPFSHLSHPHFVHPHWPVSRSSSMSVTTRASLTNDHRRNLSLRQNTPPESVDSHSGYINRALDEVPDYDIAARGLVPPLSSIHGLPSYEETERTHTLRSMSDSNVAAHFIRNNNRNNTVAL